MTFADRIFLVISMVGMGWLSAFTAMLKHFHDSQWVWGVAILIYWSLLYLEIVFREELRRLFKRK